MHFHPFSDEHFLFLRFYRFLPSASKYFTFSFLFQQPSGFLGGFFSRPASSALTDLDGKAGRQAQHDEVTQLGKQGVGNGHEVDDRRHLICQRKRMGLAQPQLGFESGEKKN